MPDFLSFTTLLAVFSLFCLFLFSKNFNLRMLITYSSRDRELCVLASYVQDRKGVCVSVSVARSDAPISDPMKTRCVSV